MSDSSSLPPDQGETALYLTIPAAASRLAVSHDTVERLIRNKGLPAIRLGRSVRIRTDQLDKWIQDYATGPGLRRRGRPRKVAPASPAPAP